MAWIESHQALERHPKVLGLATRMDWSLDQTLGKLHRLWWWALDFAPDGRLDRFPPETIAQGIGCPSDTGTDLIDALIDQKFVDATPCLRIHDWWDYCGRYLQIRYKHKATIWKKIKAFYIHSKQPTKQQTKNFQHTGTRTVKTTLNRPNQPDLTNRDQPDLTNRPTEEGIPAPRTRTRAPTESLTAPVWDAYAHAYRTRYGVLPQRNARVNSILKQLRERVGLEQAPAVAAFYVGHNDSLYVRSRHPTTLLLRDAEGLVTQMLTGQKATRQEAMQAETKDAIRDQVARVSVLLGANHDAQ